MIRASSFQQAQIKETSRKYLIFFHFGSELQLYVPVIVIFIVLLMSVVVYTKQICLIPINVVSDLWKYWVLATMFES